MVSAPCIRDAFGEAKSSLSVETAMIAVMQKMKSQAEGQMGFSTTEVGDMVAGSV